MLYKPAVDPDCQPVASVVKINERFIR